MKRAAVEIDRLLASTRSHLVLAIHDELVLEVYRDELSLVPEVKKIMESVYPHRYLPLTVGCDHSWESLADKVKGLPTPQ